VIWRPVPAQCLEVCGGRGVREHSQTLRKKKGAARDAGSVEDCGLDGSGAV